MIIFSIIGALIGAGFASGQEMYIFFYQYGVLGVVGLLLCSILIGMVIYKTFKIIINNHNISNYQDFLKEIFYSKKFISKNKYINIVYISNIIVNIFLLITFFIMISGFAAYFEQEFKINHTIGAILLCVISFIVLVKDIKGVTKTNSIIVPILIIIIVVIGIMNLDKINLKNIPIKFNYNWIIQAVVYCSYNMILVIPVLVGLGKYVKNKRQAIIISIVTSFIIFILAMSIFFLLTRINKEISDIQMPAVFAISVEYPRFKGIYGIAILLSIFSTAISIGISFLNNITKNKNSYPQIVSIMCITGVFVSNIGFSNLVKMLFPVFGYLGIIQIIKILFKNDSYGKLKKNI